MEVILEEPAALRVAVAVLGTGRPQPGRPPVERRRPGTRAVHVETGQRFPEAGSPVGEDDPEWADVGQHGGEQGEDQQEIGGC